MEKIKIISKNDEVVYKEPIIMRLFNGGETKTLFINMDEINIYKSDDEIVIENPTAGLLFYFEKWISLIKNPCSGECDYPRILNIDVDSAYEYITIINKSTNKSFRCIPKRLVYGNTNKLIFKNILRVIL